jgi:hypothetical protein
MLGIAGWKTEDAIFGDRFIKVFGHCPMEGQDLAVQRALSIPWPCADCRCLHSRVTHHTLTPLAHMLSGPPGKNTAHAAHGKEGQRRGAGAPMEWANTVLGQVALLSLLMMKDTSGRHRGHRYSTSTSTPLTVSSCHVVPLYRQRGGWKPTSQEDYGDGGAYLECHIAQYPLDMGRKKASSGNTLTLQVDSERNVCYNAIAHGGQ